MAEIPVVLVIDDDQGIAALVAEIVSLAGYEALSAGDPASGLAIAQKHRPSVVLLDVMLPGMSGFAVCQRLKADPRTQATKVIMLTALGRMEDVEEGLAAGACDYIVKPFKPDWLIKKLAQVLAK